MIANVYRYLGLPSDLLWTFKLKQVQSDPNDISPIFVSAVCILYLNVEGFDR